jgi:hypothetical protein
MHNICYAGTVVLLSYLSGQRSDAACAIYEEAFWIVGGYYDSGYLDTVESFSFRYDLCFCQSLVSHGTDYRNNLLDTTEAFSKTIVE